MNARFAIRCAVLSLVLPALADCATVQPPSGARAADEARTIRVTNDNWQAAQVYAVRNGMRIRIGTVETGETVMLRLPWTTEHADVKVFVHLIGGGDYISETAQYSRSQHHAAPREPSTLVVLHDPLRSIAPGTAPTDRHRGFGGANDRQGAHRLK